MSLSSLNAQQTLDLGNKITAILANEASEEAYGVSPALVNLLKSQDATLQGAITDQGNALNTMKSLTIAKANHRESAATTIASIHGTVLRNGDVTDEMLVALGFPPRGATKPKPAVVSAVTGLVVEPGQGSTLKIRFDRGSNAKGTMFVIDASPDGLGWTTIKTTTRVSYVAEGFAPGVAAYFRVTATTSTTAALPSQTVGVYLPSAPARVELKVA